MHASTGTYNGQLFPTPPHQTVRSVFPNTAFQSSSSSGFRSLSPWGGGWYTVETEVFIEIGVGVFPVSPALEPMLSAQVYPNPFFGVVLQVGKGCAAVPVVEVVRPSTERLIESRNDYFFWQCEVLPARGILDLLSDAAYRLF